MIACRAGPSAQEGKGSPVDEKPAQPAAPSATKPATSQRATPRHHDVPTIPAIAFDPSSLGVCTFTHLTRAAPSVAYLCASARSCTHPVLNHNGGFFRQPTKEKVATAMIRSDDTGKLIL